MTTTAGVDLPVEGAESPAWTSMPLALVDGAWTGEAPRLPANTNLRYFVEVTRDDDETVRTARTVDELWSVWVGDRRVVWCDDFDGEPTGWRSGVGVPYSDEVPFGATNDWEIGEPSGAPGEPSEAHSGRQIAGTWLDGDYLPNNAEQFVSPEVDLATVGVMRLVTFARWLAVEDGLYDQAGVWALGADGDEWTNLWTNHATQAGNTALVDGAWTLQRYDLTPVLAADGTRVEPLQIAFTLETDQGLEFSGWSIDDVCIEELDEPARHYQVRDLEVTLVPTDDPERPDVSLRWSVPWIQPVTGVAILRKEGSAPADVGDGARLRSPPQEDWVRWGETLEVLDEDPGPGEWHYAVVLAGRGRASEWWDAIVPGENEGAVTVEREDEPDAGRPEPDAGTPDQDAGPPDAGPPAPPDDEDEGGCGCHTPGSPSSPHAAWLLLLVVAMLRRRDRRQPSK
jgi:MYXO-CTERM domain-containing protein